MKAYKMSVLIKCCQMCVICVNRSQSSKMIHLFNFKKVITRVATINAGFTVPFLTLVKNSCKVPCCGFSSCCSSFPYKSMTHIQEKWISTGQTPPADEDHVTLSRTAATWRLFCQPPHVQFKTHLKNKNKREFIKNPWSLASSFCEGNTGFPLVLFWNEPKHKTFVYCNTKKK